MQDGMDKFALDFGNWTIMAPFTSGREILVVCSEPLAKVRGWRQEPGGIKLLSQVSPLKVSPAKILSTTMCL